MSVPYRPLKSFDGFDRNGQRLCWLLDMHGIELDWPDSLPPFVHRLQTDRHLAMDFWALVRSLRRSETARLSDQQIIALVVSCLCGDTPPRGHDDKAALADFTNMLAAADASVDTDANLPDALAVPERSENRPMAREWSGAFENGAEKPRIEERESFADDTLVAANPAEHLGSHTPSVLEVSQALSHHLDEALSRLELNSLELKVHLDNLDSRMSRIEPHLEDITSLVTSSLGVSSLSTFKPARPVTAAFTPPSSPGHSIAHVNHAVPVAPPEPELSRRDRASAWQSNSTIASWPDKAKTAWTNRPQWKNRPEWMNRPQWANSSQWKNKLPALPPNPLPYLKQLGIDSRQFVSARWRSVHPRYIAIVASLLVAALAGRAILINTHRHATGPDRLPPHEVKATEPPNGPQASGAGIAIPSVDAIPSLGASSADLKPSSTHSAQAEKVIADERDIKSGTVGVLATDTTQTDKQTKKRENDLVAKPTFKWLGDDSDTSPQKNDQNGANNVPRSAVLGEKAAAPAPTAVGIDTSPSGSSEPVNVSSDVMAANLLSSFSPAYPQVAKLTHQQGPVLVQAVISKDGLVDSVHVLKGHLVLRRAAANAVLSWRYKPYVLNGHPVDVATTITVTFSGDDSHESSTNNSN